MDHKGNQLPFPPQANLDELLSLARSRYPVHFEDLSVGDLTLQILQIQDMEAYIETLASAAHNGQGLNLPFWAKIWPTSILLSHVLASSYTVNDLDVLEIGAGVGVCGLVAALRGARVTITDYNPDALLFARINVLKNSLQDRVQLAASDFTVDRLSRRFQRIIGSEILYRERSYAPLVGFLEDHLAPGGEILLGKSHIFKATQFYELIHDGFDVQERNLGYKELSPQSGQPERHVCTILRLISKPGSNNKHPIPND
ncbi:MAG: methyltransferase [Desulfovermiculus sp.]|nr:methyltransferase [Desulfovermiculus sp.]